MAHDGRQVIAAMGELTDQEIRHATEVARGKCRCCGVRSHDTVRRRSGGMGWARWDFNRGAWTVIADGVTVPTCMLEPGREEVARLSVVRAVETAPPFFAGRALLLCELCAKIHTTGPTPATPRQEELPL